MTGIPINACGVSVLVLRPDPGPDGGWRVLLLRRAGIHLPGLWSHVSGGIEPGERGWQTALRELAEETGLAPVAFYSADAYEQWYEHERDEIILFPVFVALVAAGAEPTLNHEHSEYAWATPGEAEELLPFVSQRRTLRHVWAEFVEHPPVEVLRIPVPGAPGANG